MQPLTLLAEAETNVWTELGAKILEWITNFGFRLIGAILIVVIGLWLSKKFVRLLAKGRAFTKIDESVRRFLLSLIRIVLVVVVFITAALLLGIPSASFVTVLSTLGLGIGLALEGALSNLAGGLLLLINKPFRDGEMITAMGETGTVKEINFFYTVLITIDNRVLTLPNGALANTTICNVTRMDTRRVDLTFTVSYDSSIDEVRQVLLYCANRHSLVLKTPDAPTAMLTKHGDSSLEFTLRAWCRTEDYWTIHFDLIESVKKAFDAAGIKIPYPQMDVHIKDVPALAAEEGKG